MPDSLNFLDNLENLRLVLSVALEHFQHNRNVFVRSAQPGETRRAEASMAKSRTLIEQLLGEFAALESQLTKARSN